MKYKIHLGISLALNVVLAGVLIFFAVHRPAPNDLPQQKPLPAPPLPSLPSVTLLPSSPEQPLTSTPTHGTTGREGLQQWLQQLRAAGAPNNVLAGLVIPDFEVRWDKKLREFRKRYDAGDADDADQARFQRQRDDELEKELRTALGDEGFRQWDMEKSLRDLDPVALKLSSSEMNAIYQLRKDRDRKDRALEEAHQNGEIDEADFNEQQLAVQNDYSQQFETLLGDERYAALQSSEEGSLEGAVQRRLKDIKPTRAQLEGIIAAQRNWSEQRTQLDQIQEAQAQGEAYEKQMRAIDAARDQEYQRVLGTNGFSNLQKADDISYQKMKRYAKAWQLSDRDIDYVYRALQYSQTGVSDYQQLAKVQQEQGESVDWVKIQENVQQFSNRMEQFFRTYLGEDRFNKLKKNGLFGSQNP